MDAKCICCGKHMVGLMKTALQPIDGLAFATYGHYGSAFFDPMDGSSLEIAVCDECLQAAEKDGKIWRKQRIKSRPA